MSIFTITATRQQTIDSIDVDEIRIAARGHHQHIWNETTLTGVSAAGMKRISKFLANHDGWRITVDAGQHNPQLIGYERD